MNGLAVIPGLHYRQIMSALMDRVRQCFDEAVFDLAQIEFDRRVAPDGHCPTCGCRPLTMGHRERVSAPAIMYADDAAESQRLRAELRKADVERTAHGRSSCGREEMSMTTTETT